jgi:hypothetical protein
MRTYRSASCLLDQAARSPNISAITRAAIRCRYEHRLPIREPSRLRRLRRYRSYRRRAADPIPTTAIALELLSQRRQEAQPTLTAALCPSGNLVSRYTSRSGPAATADNQGDSDQNEN